MIFCQLPQFVLLLLWLLLLLPLLQVRSPCKGQVRLGCFLRTALFLVGGCCLVVGAMLRCCWCAECNTTAQHLPLCSTVRALTTARLCKAPFMNITPARLNILAAGAALRCTQPSIAQTTCLHRIEPCFSRIMPRCTTTAPKITATAMLQNCNDYLALTSISSLTVAITNALRSGQATIHIDIVEQANKRCIMKLSPTLSSCSWRGSLQIQPYRYQCSIGQPPKHGESAYRCCPAWKVCV